MKKSMLMMLMLLAVLLTCSNSWAALSVEIVTVIPYHVDYDADGNATQVPATKVHCVKGTGGITAGDCNWDLYNRTYHPAAATTCDEEPDDEDNSGVAKGRNPWHN